MSIVGSHLDISEARNGVRELIKMYPDLKKGISRIWNCN